DMPAMKAIGVRAFAAFLAGEIGLAEAVARAAAATRQSAKRQATWFRHQTGGEWQRLRGAEHGETAAPVNPAPGLPCANDCCCAGSGCGFTNRRRHFSGWSRWCWAPAC